MQQWVFNRTGFARVLPKLSWVPWSPKYCCLLLTLRISCSLRKTHIFLGTQTPPSSFYRLTLVANAYGYSFSHTSINDLKSGLPYGNRWLSMGLQCLSQRYSSLFSLTTHTMRLSCLVFFFQLDAFSIHFFFTSIRFSNPWHCFTLH